MQRGLWVDLPRPIIGISPMDGVSDHPFRHIMKRHGQPDLLFTEFTSAEGVSHNAERLFRDLEFDETQRPIIAQIFGHEPEAFYVTAVILGYLGFDGIDINMGCPAKSVQGHGSGAALIRTPKLAQELVRQTRRGTQAWADGTTLDELPNLKTSFKELILSRHACLPAQCQVRKELPVSVKTRIGYDKPVVDDWISTLLEVEPVAITVHGRTLKQMYSGEADWEQIARAVEIAQGTGTLILGNGDIRDVNTLRDRVQESGVDGVLVGRATQGNPWLLREMIAARDAGLETAQSMNHPEVTLRERVALALEHTRVFEQTYPNEHFLPMRKHLAWYIADFPGASEFRMRLVRANSAQEVAAILQELDTNA